MGEVVNLNQARKIKARADDKARAAANRAAHGRTAAEKKTARTERERAERHIDGHKRED